MQLKGRDRFRRSGVLLATLLALGVPGSSRPQEAPADPVPEPSDLARRSGEAEEPEDDGPLGSEAATRLSVYSDDDGVLVITPLVSFKQRVGDATSVSLEYDADVLTAASVDVRTSASEEFEETRHGAQVAIDHRLLSQEMSLSGSASISRELDYNSVTLGGGVSQDLLSKNLTVAGGYALVLNHVGRSGTPGANFHDTLDIHAFSGSVTQILSPVTWIQFSTSLIGAFGYQASVYRFVPVFLEGTVDPAEVSEETLVDGTVKPLARIAESLPRTRVRWAGVGRVNHYLSDFRLALAADYRLYTDTWSVMSHTLDAKVYKELPGGLTLRLRNRFYAQSAAGFYRPVYTVNDPDQRFAWLVMDRELSGFWYDQVGVKLAWHLPRMGRLESLTLDAKVDYQYAHYANFAYLPRRNAVVVELGMSLEL